MSGEFDKSPITSKYKMIRHGIFKFEIVDQYEQKFIESEFLLAKMGLKESFKKAQDQGKGLEVPWWELKDSTNTTMGEIAVQAKDRDPFIHPFTIKNSMGETVATFSTLGLTKEKMKKFKDDKSGVNVIIETPTRKFTVVNVEKTEEKRNWRGKRGTKKYTTKVIVVDEKENHCFSIIPKVKDGLFEIKTFEDLLDLNPFIICTTSFLISILYWTD